MILSNRALVLSEEIIENYGIIVEKHRMILIRVENYRIIYCIEKDI